MILPPRRGCGHRSLAHGATHKALAVLARAAGSEAPAVVGRLAIRCHRAWARGRRARGPLGHCRGRARAHAHVCVLKKKQGSREKRCLAAGIPAGCQLDPDCGELAAPLRDLVGMLTPVCHHPVEGWVAGSARNPSIAPTSCSCEADGGSAPERDPCAGLSTDGERSTWPVRNGRRGAFLSDERGACSSVEGGEH
eukprot:COSAG01_NODE_3413_length_6125_cov_26.475938_5_plen_195_part_00